MTITRRSIMGGLAALPAIGSASLAAARSFQTETTWRDAPSSQRQIADRVNALATELSLLLGDLDGGNWCLDVRPHFHGQPLVGVEPVKLPPRVALEQAMARATAALNRMQPGAWRAAHNVEMGFAVISNHDWRRA